MISTEKNYLIALGSNVGDKFVNLQKAIDALFESVGTVEKIAPVYETPAWGFEGDSFYNTAVSVSTSLPSEAVLKKLLAIEKRLGRLRNQESGYQSRTIDLDILFCDDEITQLENLQIPHPQLENRKFVLQPLTDIAPDLLHPVSQKSIREILAGCEDQSTIHKLPRWLKNPKDNFLLSRYNFISIEGNIGAGKTTLATKIANDFNAKLILERFADNPFLPKFYEDKDRYAFALEMSFLADRYQQTHDDLSQLDLFKDFIIADYDIYKSLIFAKVTLQEEEFKLYRRLFEMMYKDTKRPDLYVFLMQSPEKLLANIKNRGREYEQSITPEYLESLQKGYLDFIKNQNPEKVKIIDITEMDFVSNRKDYLQLLTILSED